MYYKRETGIFGEKRAEEYLIENQYKLITKNFSCRFGEIDLIARDVQNKEIVFIEVKTRNNEKYGNPAESIDYKKKKHIYKTAEYFLHVYKLEKEFVRIDVIEVYINKNKSYTINHIKQAF